MVISDAVGSGQSNDFISGSPTDVAELERRRLERDLHDHAERRLLALSHRLGTLASMVAPSSEEAHAVAAARAELNAALRELRELVHALHPAALSRHGLAVAIDGLAARCPTPVAVTVDIAERPGPTAEIAAYYLIAEALANTAKHAGATTASVAVRLRGGQLLVNVTDDGCGGADPAAGAGLRGLADRISLMGGSLDVSSPPGRGTSLRARIPASSASAARALAA
jgi:signal transduction histidine kinase